MDGCLLFVMSIIKLCDANKQYVELSIRTTSKPLGRLDLLECAVLEPSEYDKHVAKGSCPPQPTKFVAFLICPPLILRIISPAEFKKVNDCLLFC